MCPGHTRRCRRSRDPGLWTQWGDCPSTRMTGDRFRIIPRLRHSRTSGKESTSSWLWQKPPADFILNVEASRSVPAESIYLSIIFTMEGRLSRTERISLSLKSIDTSATPRHRAILQIEGGADMILNRRFLRTIRNSPTTNLPGGSRG